MTEDSDATTAAVDTHQEPPRDLQGILRRLGPGLILAGAIVGSGELIATTKTGAEAGFTLLWLILIGCTIKVFAQVEFGRYCIVNGRTSMDGMNEVPGPRLRVNWLMWYWLLMFTVSLGQLGGIVGGVGQALAISMPMTGDLNEVLSEQQVWHDQRNPLREQLRQEEQTRLASPDAAIRVAARQRIEQALTDRFGELPRQDDYTYDDKYWSAVVAMITMIVLFNGRYGMIQTFATVMVASFTALTIANLIALQSIEAWRCSTDDILTGLSFGLPDDQGLATALATFGIIGVGASELVSYPYWCLEKGYARFTGPRDDSPGWAQRANGWLRVMRWDAWCSMVVYTFATIAFYMLGACVLARKGLNPEGNQMIRDLGQMYTPVFGEWARLLFLFGAFAVLYSTFFVANAANARMATDALKVFQLRPDQESSRRWWVRFFSVTFPVTCLLIYACIPKPAKLVLLGGLLQAVMLPMLGLAALFFRYRRCDDRVKPGILWDLCFWLSVFGLAISGGWAAIGKIQDIVQWLLR